MDLQASETEIVGCAVTDVNHRAADDAAARNGHPGLAHDAPDAEKKVLAAARLWLVERSPLDACEKALAAAIVRAWPKEMCGKEDCPCGEPENCDECLSSEEVEALVSKWERESSDVLP
jgi:hypothetical protein